MAVRPVFFPVSTPPFVKVKELSFKWYPGFAKSQAQKSIASLHRKAAEHGIKPVLEISSKSAEPLGVKLSAFNLQLVGEVHPQMSVECAFQGSKVFEHGEQFTELYNMSSREAKKDDRLRNSGEVIRFTFFGEVFPTEPKTAFYDWLYLKALHQNKDLAQQLLTYEGFTDIAFNPKKSYNCQARSAALFVALNKAGLIDKVLQSKQAYLETVSPRERTQLKFHV